MILNNHNDARQQNAVVNPLTEKFLILETIHLCNLASLVYCLQFETQVCPLVAQARTPLSDQAIFLAGS